MLHVSDALKKYKAEQAQQAAQAQQELPAVAQVAADVPAARAKTPDAPSRVIEFPQVSAAPSPARPLKYAQVLIAHDHNNNPHLAEEYRALRTSLLANANNERFCYLVTSAQPGEGKTVTCLNLAIAMAERIDRRTIVIDCDLRRQGIARLLGTDAKPGVADFVRGTASLAECTKPTSYPNLFFIPGGGVASRQAGDVIGRPEMEDFIGRVRRDYDYVLFDSPPINTISDAGVIGRMIGQALLVVQMCKTNRESAATAIRLLNAANVTPVGIVLTHQEFHIPNYLYENS